MRRITEIKDILTVEEWDAITNHIEKQLLRELLTELGFDVLKIWRRAHNHSPRADQLKKILVYSIRRNMTLLKQQTTALANLKKQVEAGKQLWLGFIKEQRQ